jgi:hypothetical protein
MKAMHGGRGTWEFEWKSVNERKSQTKMKKNPLILGK